MSAYELYKTILMNNANLKGYWRFEETSGTSVADSSGNSNTGTASRTNILNNAGGVYGNMATFVAASSDKITIADTSTLKPTTSFSVGGWVKTSTTGTTKRIIQSYDYTGTKTAGIFLGVESDNKVRIVSGNNTGTTQNTHWVESRSTTSVTDGAWYHVVGTWDGATLRIYVNGKHEASTAWANEPVYVATNKIYIGAGYESGNGGDTAFMNGSLDDTFFLNGTALSADQIKELYEGRYIGEWMPQANLVGLWHLNGNSTDTSGNNNHGTDTTITYGSANGRMGTQGSSLNGTASKIVLTDSSPLKPTGSYTVSVWVNATGFAAATRGIFHTQSQNTAVAGIALFCTSAGALKLQQGNNTGTVANTNYRELTGATLSTGVWYWICGVYDDGNTMKLYVNGAESATVANAIDPAYAATTYIRIGCQNDTGTDKNFWNGKIDEVAIFSRALTAAEIRHWYAHSTGKYI